jgi:hypothetical protein
VPEPTFPNCEATPARVGPDAPTKARFVICDVMWDAAMQPLGARSVSGFRRRGLAPASVAIAPPLSVGLARGGPQGPTGRRRTPLHLRLGVRGRFLPDDRTRSEPHLPDGRYVYGPAHHRRSGRQVRHPDPHRAAGRVYDRLRGTFDQWDGPDPRESGRRVRRPARRDRAPRGTRDRSGPTVREVPAAGGPTPKRAGRPGLGTSAETAWMELLPAETVALLRRSGSVYAATIWTLSPPWRVARGRISQKRGVW